MMEGELSPGRVSVPLSGWAGRVGRAAVFLAALTPLVYLPGVLFPSTIPRTLYFRGFVLLGSFAFVGAVLNPSARFEGRRDPLLWALAGWIGIALLAGLLGPAPVHSLFSDLPRFWGVWGWVHILGFYVLIRTFIRGSDWLPLLGVCALVAVPVSLYALAQAYPGAAPFEPIRPQPKPTGLLGNPGYLAAYLTVAGATAGWVASQRSRWRWIGVVALPVIVFALVHTSIRAVFLGLAAAILGLFLLEVVRRLPGRRGGLIAGLLAAAALVVAVLAIPSPEVMAADPGLGVRWHALRAGLGALGDRPVLGWGPENFALAFAARFPPEFYTLRESTFQLDRAHNAFLEALVTTGPLGLFSYLGMWATLIWWSARSVRGGSRGGRWLFLASIAYPVFLLFWFEDTSTWVPLLVVGGLCAHLSGMPPLVQAGEDREMPARRSAILGVAAVLSCVLLYTHAWLPWQTARALYRAEFERGHSIETRLGLYRTALTTGAPQQQQALLRYERFLQRLVPLRAELRADPAALEGVAEAIRFGLAAAEREIARDPLNDALHTRRAGIALTGLYMLGTPGTYDIARDALLEAIRLSPTNLRHRHLLADLYARAGREQEALAVLEDALDRYDRFGETHYFMSRIHLERGRLNEAASWLRRSIELGYTRDDALPLQVVRRLIARGDAMAARTLAESFMDARYPAAADWRRALRSRASMNERALAAFALTPVGGS